MKNDMEDMEEAPLLKPKSKSKNVKLQDDIPPQEPNTPVQIVEDVPKKSRKPRSTAQIESFKKANEAKKANFELRRKQKLVKSAELVLQEHNQLSDESYESDNSDEVVIVKSKKITKKPPKKSQRQVIYQLVESDGESSFDDEVIACKPRRRGPIPHNIPSVNDYTNFFV